MLGRAERVKFINHAEPKKYQSKIPSVPQKKGCTTSRVKKLLGLAGAHSKATPPDPQRRRHELSGGAKRESFGATRKKRSAFVKT